LTALDFTMPWCCTRHSKTVPFSEFFKGRFLYQDAQTGDLYYSTSENPSDRVKILPPLKEKRKAQDRRRTTDERKSLASRLFAWRHNAHTNDPLTAVRLPSFIIDDASIETLAKFHPLDITISQIRVALESRFKSPRRYWVFKMYVTTKISWPRKTAVSCVLMIMFRYFVDAE
jgi:hypothetical protein